MTTSLRAKNTSPRKTTAQRRKRVPGCSKVEDIMQIDETTENVKGGEVNGVSSYRSATLHLSRHFVPCRALDADFQKPLRGDFHHGVDKARSSELSAVRLLSSFSRYRAGLHLCPIVGSGKP